MRHDKLNDVIHHLDKLLVPRIKNHLSSFKLGFLNIFHAKTCCVVCRSYCLSYSATNMARKNVQKNKFFRGTNKSLSPSQLQLGLSPALQESS